MLLACVLACCSTVFGQERQALGENDFSATDVAAAQQFGQTIGVVDWLGPLAPVALSPFFGITCLLDAVWAIVSPPKKIGGPELVVFPAAPFGVFPARTRCTLTKTESGWKLTQRRLVGGTVVLEVPCDHCQAERVAGYFTNCIRLSGTHTAELTFSRWYNPHLPELTAVFNVSMKEHAAPRQGRAGLNTEMA